MNKLLILVQKSIHLQFSPTLRADNFFDILENGKFIDETNKIIALKTIFGFVLRGTLRNELTSERGSDGKFIVQNTLQTWYIIARKFFSKCNKEIFELGNEI